MNLTGLWAAPDLFDCQLNVTDDGVVFLTFGEKETFDFPLSPYAYTLGEASLSFRWEEISVALDRLS